MFKKNSFKNTPNKNNLTPESQHGYKKSLPILVEKKCRCNDCAAQPNNERIIQIIEHPHNTPRRSWSNQHICMDRTSENQSMLYSQMNHNNHPSSSLIDPNMSPMHGMPFNNYNVISVLGHRKVQKGYES